MTEVTEVRIPVSGGATFPAALAEPGPGPEPRAAVIVLHEMLGLNDDIRRIAHRFADAGYVTLAPDFLAGLGPRPFCMARFFRGLAKVGTGRPYRQLEAAREWLGHRAEVEERRIAVAGFCIGGGFALLYATGAGKGRLQAVAPFYAALPPEPERSLTGVCPVVASYGGRDGVFGREGQRLAGLLDAVGVDHDVKTYPKAGHSFMSRHGQVLTAIERRLPVHGGFHEASAEDAWRRTLAFFARHLGPAA
jgi:carboxymethylenebutenolidase